MRNEFSLAGRDSWVVNTSLETKYDVKHVRYQCLQLQMTMSPERAESEKRLGTWSARGSPGFVESLLRVIASEEAAKPVRLLAAILLKNTIKAPVWSDVPENERSLCRSMVVRLMSLMARTGQDPIATQLALVIGKIGEIEYPRQYPGLVSELVSQASLGDGAEYRKVVMSALRALKFLFNNKNKAIKKTKRASPWRRRTRVLEDENLGGSLETERKISEIWERYLSKFTSSGEIEDAKTAARATALLREMYEWYPKGDAQRRQVLSRALQASLTLENPGIYGEIKYHADRIYYKIAEVATRCLDGDPIEFAMDGILKGYLSLYTNRALFSSSVEEIQQTEGKHRVILLTFLASALTCPHYTPSSYVGRPGGFLEILRDASEAVSRLVSPPPEGRCQELIHAIVTKYISLSPEEQLLWTSGPEAYIRRMDSECHNADNLQPRATGIDLMIYLLGSNSETVKDCLLNLRSGLLGEDFSTVSGREGGEKLNKLFLRDACYRAIGELMAKIPTMMDPESWIREELMYMLQPENYNTYPQSVLKARAVWLLGVISYELSFEPWAEAFNMAVSSIESQDAVVSLIAMSSVTAMVSNVLHATTVTKESDEFADFGVGETQEESMEDGNEVIDKTLEEKRRYIAQTTERVFRRSFDILTSLKDISSIVRVLQMISFYVELLGPDIKPQLGILCEALPRIWTVASERVGDTEWFWLCRLYSSLATTLNHLVSRLNIVATGDPRVQGVIYPLLDHMFATKDIEETLATEALGLWRTILASGSEAARPLVKHLPSLTRIMGRGEHYFLGFSIIEGMLILGFRSEVGEQWGRIVQCLRQSVLAASPIARGDLDSTVRKGSGTDFTRRATEDALVATSLVSLLLQLYPTEMHTSLMPLFSLMAQTLIYAHPPPPYLLPSNGTPNPPPPTIPRDLKSLIGAYSETLCYIIYQNPSSLGAISQGIVPGFAGGIPGVDGRAGGVGLAEILVAALLEMADPREAAQEAEGWKESAKEVEDEALDYVGPRVPNMRYEFVNIMDPEGLGRHRRFFTAVGLCALLAASGQSQAIKIWDSGRCTPLLQKIYKNILRANEDRIDIEKDRASILRSLASDPNADPTSTKSQNPKKSSLLGYSWNPVDQTTRQRVILATQDPLWSMNVPTALRSATVRMMRIVDGGDAARGENVRNFAAALGLSAGEAKILEKVCTGEQDVEDRAAAVAATAETSDMADGV
ncbi:hypothetical protein AAMO2058_001053200 [Amorphochlora amoebiformis]